MTPRPARLAHPFLATLYDPNRAYNSVIISTQ